MNNTNDTKSNAPVIGAPGLTVGAFTVGVPMPAEQTPPAAEGRRWGEGTWDGDAAWDGPTPDHEKVPA